MWKTRMSRFSTIAPHPKSLVKPTIEVTVNYEPCPL
jgi:hypothetical protein